MEANAYHNRSCEVASCGLPRAKVSRYCERHDLQDQRTGHPCGRTIRKHALKPYVVLAQRYIHDYRDHEAVQAALRWLDNMVYRDHPDYPLHPRAKPEERVTRFLRRMKKSAVSPELMLASCVAMFLFRMNDPLSFPSDRHHRHQVANYFLRLAPAPYNMTYRSGRGAKKYDRITAPTREFLYKRLSETIGICVYNMSSAIYSAHLTETKLLKGVNVPFNFPSNF
jgi:hypothetical protein